jgi:hypothetical protein
VNAVASYKGKLYAGGNFLFAGGDLIPFIAKYGSTYRESDSFGSSTETGSVSPNPVSNSTMMKLNIDIKDHSENNLSFNIYDVTGRLLLKTTNIHEEFYFDRKELSSGAYIYKVVSDENEVIQTGKILIE